MMPNQPALIGRPFNNQRYFSWLAANMDSWRIPSGPLAAVRWLNHAKSSIPDEQLIGNLYWDRKWPRCRKGTGNRRKFARCPGIEDIYVESWQFSLGIVLAFCWHLRINNKIDAWYMQAKEHRSHTHDDHRRRPVSRHFRNVYRSHLISGIHPNSRRHCGNDSHRPVTDRSGHSVSTSDHHYRRIDHAKIFGHCVSSSSYRRRLGVLRHRNY